MQRGTEGRRRLAALSAGLCVHLLPFIPAQEDTAMPSPPNDPGTPSPVPPPNPEAALRPEIVEAMIAQLAYAKWERAGKPISKGEEFWWEAKTEILGPGPPSRPA
jgi:hypothetical protein